MYENENYSGNNTTVSEKSPYFDYTAKPIAETERTPDEGRRRKKREHGKKGGVVKKFVLAICLGLCFGLCAGAGFYGIGFGLGQLGKEDAKVSGTAQTAEAPNNVTVLPYDNNGNDKTTTNHITYVQDDISDMVEDVMPAMVSIINNYMTTSMNFWGQTYSEPGVASGSGIIVGETEEELLIATNNHVVEGTTGLEVTFIDGNTAPAVIKGTDADMDLAVIAVSLSELSEESKKAITVAVLGDSDNLKLGEPVVAIGNALGYGQSVTNGIVSALNREIESEDGANGTFIQTNAAINPGNSGGALLNINGEVIGINSSKIGGSTIEGMGYAIPISSASPILSELMVRQTRVKVDEEEVGYMGITMQAVTNEIAEAYGFPKGVYIREVEEDSPASKAGIRKGDFIVKFDGQRITSATELQDTLQYFRAGDTATVTVKRSVDGEYETFDLEITLGSRDKN